MKLNRAIAILAVATLAALSAQPADVEVVVTASRIEEPAGQAAASVTVITAEELTASGEATLVDALERVAGVSFRSTTGSPANAEAAMRGFGENSHGRVLVLVDGRRVNRPDMATANWLQVPVENVERVEILRGPATVLYGDHAVGGVINIITKKGTEKVSVAASAMGGSFLLNQQRLGGSGTAGPVRFALSGERTASEGYRERSAWSSLGGGASLDADIGDRLAASLRLAYNQTETQLPGALTKAQWEDDPTQAANPDDAVVDRSFDVDLGFESLPGRALEARANLFYRWKAVENDFPSYFTPTFTDVGIQTVGATPRVRLWADLPFAAVEATGGVDLVGDSLALERYTDEARTARTADVEVSRLSAGGYANAAFTFAERFRVELGGRYELARVAAEASLGSTLDDSKTHHGVAGSLSAAWLPREQSKVYVRADRVYRYPFVDEQVVYSGYGPDTFLEDLDPESGAGVEVGFDAVPLQGLRVAASGYWLEMSDEIALNTLFVNENLDRTRHLGAQAEAWWKAGPLAVAASYTAQITTFREGANDGNEVPLVPNHEAFAGVRLVLPAGLQVAANARYVSESYQGGDNGNTKDKVPDYLLLAASATWRPGFVPGGLELFAGVENLLDTRYVSYVYWDGYYPAPGRSWRVGGSYRY